MVITLDTVWLALKINNLEDNKSKELIGIASNKSGAVGFCRMYEKRTGIQLPVNERISLININKTIGYKGGHDFCIAEIELNKLL